MGLEGLEGEWGAIVRRDVLVFGCGAYSIDDHAGEDYNEINGYIYASVVYLILSVFLFCSC